MTLTSLMSIFPLHSLRAQFQTHSGFLDASLFEILKEKDFTPDARAVLRMLRIPTAKDLIERLGETNRDGGLSTHFSIIHSEFKDYLTSRGFPLDSDMIQPIAEKPRKSIGIVDCAQDAIHLISHMHFDFHLDITSTTCNTAPISQWHTKLTLRDSSIEKTRQLLIRDGDKVILLPDGTTPPLQIEHLGFEGTQAHIRFRSNVMMLKVP